MPKVDDKPLDQKEPPHKPWWGEFSLREDQSMVLTFGPKSIVIARLSREWFILEEPPGCIAEPDGDVQARITRRRRPPDAGDDVRRFAFGKTDPELTITPCTADRPVVARPTSPVTIPPEEATVLYISSPLWMKIAVHQPEVALADMPIYRPSDTWFGANTRDGKLCYSSRSHARMHLENLPLRAQRTVTAVRIQNADTSPFTLERLNIPVPCLSLFTTKDGGLWTEEVTVVREKGGQSVSLHIAEKPALAVERVAGSREVKGPLSLISSIGEWLG